MLPVAAEEEPQGPALGPAVRASAAMEATATDPKGFRPTQVKPNRDKIRTILSMSNVIELQRQLLTTVMENEVSPAPLAPLVLYGLQ